MGFPTCRDSRKCEILGRLENLPYTQLKIALGSRRQTQIVDALFLPAFSFFA